MSSDNTKTYKAIDYINAARFVLNECTDEREIGEDEHGVSIYSPIYNFTLELLIDVAAERTGLARKEVEELVFSVDIPHWKAIKRRIDEPALEDCATIIPRDLPQAAE